MGRKKKNQWFLRLCGVMLAWGMMVSSFDGWYPIMKALAAGTDEGTVGQENAEASFSVTIYPEMKHGTITLESVKSTFSEGETVTLRITPDTGYKIIGINGISIEYTYSEDILTFAMPGNDIVIRAIFDLNEVMGITIKKDPSSYGYVQHSVNEDSNEITLEAHPHGGRRFVGWYDESDPDELLSSNPNYKVTPTTTARTLIASFAEEEVVYENRYFEDFESSDWLNEWTFVNSYSDGWGWNSFGAEDFPGERYVIDGTASLGCAANGDAYPSDLDQWAITPAIIVPKNGRLQFQIKSYLFDDFEVQDEVSVYFGMSPEIDKMRKVADCDFNAYGRDIICGLFPYEGQKIYVGIQHKGSTSGRTILIDYVSVSGVSSVQRDPALQITKKALSLQDTIAIDFKVPKASFENYHDPYLVVWQTDYKHEISNYRDDGDFLVFTYRVAPQNMGERVLAIPHALDADNNDVTGAASIYSVAEYCYNMLGKEDYEEEEYATFRRLLVDILRYGDAAQIYADYDTDDLAGAKLTAEQLAMGTDVNEEMSYRSVKSRYANSQDVIEYARIERAALFLASTVNIRFKYWANDLTGLRVVITDDEECKNVIAAYPANAEFVDDNYLYYVTVNALNAGQMRKTIYATVMKGNERVSNTYRYSIESYVASMKEKNIPNLNNLLDAMMRYGDSASDFAAGR
ncbi:MAG: choice-of-anchor J domain-containing protein [Lachnospiraceae bacterium]|nr:choice-of-anchor J domain-containing protein [Lachnospiraceae bacterium]